MTKRIDPDLFDQLVAAVRRQVVAELQKTLSTESLTNLLADHDARITTLESDSPSPKLIPPPGYIPLKAVTKYGFLPEMIRRRALRGQISYTRRGARWFVYEADIQALAQKMVG
jgi:hypothetical protein